MFFTDFVQYKTFDEVPSPSPLNFLDSLFLACAGLNVLFYWMGSFDNDILSYCVNKWINCLSQWWYSVPYIIILSFMKKLRPWPFTVMKSFFCLKGTWPHKKKNNFLTLRPTRHFTVSTSFLRGVRPHRDPIHEPAIACSMCRLF